MRTIGIILAFALGAFWGVVFAQVARNRGRATIRLIRRITASPESIITLVSQVERESEIIPFVRSVYILSQGHNWVRYRVTLGLVFSLAQVVYRKSWDKEKRFIQWRSESGSLRLAHSGRITFSPTSEGWLMRLSTEYAFRTPVIGWLLTALAQVPLALALWIWLRRLASNERRERRP
ncbi:MAG: SRPBCC family protein [Armatimonadota bacterium]|nr:SRPBCC family protein [Armatimonadota bacterium]